MRLTLLFDSSSAEFVSSNSGIDSSDQFQLQLSKKCRSWEGPRTWLTCKMAAVDNRERSLDDLKASLRDGVQHLIARLSEEILADEDGIDYLCTHIDRLLNLLTRASTLFFIPVDLISLLVRARQAINERTSKSANGDSVPLLYTGCKGRPAIAISREQLELYLDYGFTAVKIAQLFSVSVKTIFRRLNEWGIERKKYSDLSDMELDNVM